jgi:aryl-alcohol dehydrogenase-like predicted oxidoreductase
VKEAAPNGRLTEQNLMEQLPALKRLGHAQHTTIDALAIAAALSQPWSDIVLSGAVTTSQLESKLTAANLAETDI